MKKMFLDSETRSRTDISDGTDLYTRDAECLIVTYAFETGPAKIWEPWVDPIPPEDFWSAIHDPAVTLVAHNAAFDRLILERALHIATPIERWMCTMAQAASCGLPGSLEMLGRVCGLDLDKQKLVEDGKLIDTFCVPQRATDKFIQPQELPNEWQRFCNYAIRDTESLRALFERMPASNYGGSNLDMWHLDQRINERGFQFDSALAEAACAFLSSAKVASDDTVRAASRGAVVTVSQRDKLLKHLQEKLSTEITNLRAGEVREWLERDDLDPLARTLLEERLEAGKSSGAKYRRGLQLVSPDGRIRHGLKFCGAGRTGRWSGKGFQIQNLPRPAVKVTTP